MEIADCQATQVFLVEAVQVVILDFREIAQADILVSQVEVERVAILDLVAVVECLVIQVFLAIAD